MKKIIIYISVVLVALIAWSCDKKYEAPGPAATKMFPVVPEGSTQIHDTIYFGDLSSGVTSRKWTFPTGVTDIVDSDNDRTSENSTVGATFSEPGIYSIQLHMEFDKALVDDGDFNGQSVVDTVFNVTIVDSVRAWFIAQYIDMEGNDSSLIDVSNGTFELWGGERVRYTTLRQGNPTDYIWYFEGGNPEFYEGTDTSVVVQYPSLGTYGVFHAAYRTTLGGSFDSTWMAEFIEVIPSERPAQVAGAARTSLRTIEMEFSQNVLDPSDELDNFTIDVTNGEDIILVNIVSLAMHPTKEHAIVITVDADIYDNDRILLGYTPGTFANAYAGVVAAFSEVRVEPLLVDVVPEEFDASFEQIPSLWMKAGWDPPFDANSYEYSITDEITPQEGAYCMKISVPDGGGSAVQSPVPILYEAGYAYRAGIWVYCENATDWASTSGGIWRDFNVAPQDIATLASNFEGAGWYNIQREWFNAAELEQYIWGRAVNLPDPPTGQTLEIYIDNFYCYRMVYRPETN